MHALNVMTYLALSAVVVVHAFTKALRLQNTYDISSLCPIFKISGTIIGTERSIWPKLFVN